MMSDKTNFTNQPVPKMNLCTTTAVPGKEASACVGDSGGPLVVAQGDVRGPKSTFTHVGVVSWGVKYCDGVTWDDIFTRTFHYRDWICANCDGCCTDGGPTMAVAQ